MKSDWKSFLIDAGAEFQDGELLHFGNPVQEREVAMSGLVFAHLDYLGVIAVTGADAAGFLQAQLSNDIGECTEDTSQLSAYCTPKGRVLGLLRIFRREDRYFLRLPADSLEAVLQRLRMYVLRANVMLEDVSDSFHCIGVSGDDAAEEIGKVTGEAPAADNRVVHAGALSVIRLPGPGVRFEIYTESMPAACELWDSLNVHGAPVGSRVWRLLEIRAGMPNVFAKTAEMFVPQMLNLQLLGAVNFRKGCYPGQEVVARMQYLGTLKRRMYLGHINRDEPVSPGDALFEADDDEQAAGRIVDSQAHPDGGQLALAVLQIKSAAGADLHLGDVHGPQFVQQALPYDFGD